MKNYNYLSIIILCALMIACGDKNLGDKIVFGIDESNLKEQYVPIDNIEMLIKNPENLKVDSVVYFINDKNIGSKKGFDKLSFSFKDSKLGYQHLKTMVYFEGKMEADTSRVELVSGFEPKLLKYKIVNTYPHDIQSFTEGFEFYKDTLYESTGSGNDNTYKSYFRKYDYKTGKVYQQIDLEQPHFGEGITVLNGKLFQLTWQSYVGFVYNINSLKREKTFNFDKKIEGWGLTNDGKNLYQSDGTEKIWMLNPENQKITGNINVYTGSSKVKSLNELEWIDGKIYGNIWQKDVIAIINPNTGAVEGVLDLSELRKLITGQNAEVLNGIAYNPKTKTVFVTGKNWDKMFEIQVVK
jgi:glutaminyl-peptide cyclotransferase